VARCLLRLCGITAAFVLALALVRGEDILLDDDGEGHGDGSVAECGEYDASTEGRRKAIISIEFDRPIELRLRWCSCKVGAIVEQGGDCGCSTTSTTSATCCSCVELDMVHRHRESEQESDGEEERRGGGGQIK
jgi:hypothetical protein